MGDVLSLVEEVQGRIDREKAEQLVKKIQKGKDFDLVDFREQLMQMSKMGGVAGLLDKLPGMGQVPDQLKHQVNDKDLVRLVAMIDSMTPQERAFPAIIRGGRKRRIAMGSGTQIQDLNRLLKQFTVMQKTMKKMKGGGMARMLRSLSGRLPGMGMPGRPPF
jgi:signal recognition particle subunit SRP54